MRTTNENEHEGFWVFYIFKDLANNKNWGNTRVDRNIHYDFVEINNPELINLHPRVIDRYNFPVISWQQQLEMTCEWLAKEQVS
jgi:hypothetical protein